MGRAVDAHVIRTSSEVKPVMRHCYPRMTYYSVKKEIPTSVFLFCVLLLTKPAFIAQNDRKLERGPGGKIAR